VPELEPPLVVAVVGSLRAHGNTSILVDVLLEEVARHGIRVEKVTLGERRFAGCLGHDSCAEWRVGSLGDDAADILDAVYAAEGPIFSLSGYADTAGSAAERPELLAAARWLAADLGEALLSGT
jgi:NADPH-dependent FMN reductase